MTREPRRPRDLRVDVVRGLALISMYVAHCAPTGGRAGVLTLSEYLTYPLFAALVGAGAQLSDRRLSGPGSLSAWWTVAVRGAVLIGLGLLLEDAGAQIVIVLVHLGLLTWVAAPLARARTSVVGGVALVAYVVAPPLHDSLLSVRGDLLEGNQATKLRLLDLVVTGPSYRLSSMVFFAAVGILLARAVLHRTPRLQASAGLVLLLMSGVVFALGATDAFTLEAYDVTPVEHLFVALLLSAVFLIGVSVAARTPRLCLPLAAIGQMSLTLYVAQIYWLAYDVTALHPGQRDDSWANVAILVLGSLLAAGLWQTLVRHPPWQRGPVEGATAIVASWWDGHSTPARRSAAEPSGSGLDRAHRLDP